MAENSPSHCASEAARLLNSTWKNTKNAKLLRHPPVHPQPAWVNMVLGKSSNLVTDIASGLGTVPDMPEAEQLMAELLQWHVPDLIAAQLAWLGQRPDLLGLQCGSERQAAVDNGSGAYWLVWRKCLKFITILTQFVRRFHIHEQLGRRINADCAFNIAESLEKHGLLQSLPGLVQQMLEHQQQQLQGQQQHQVLHAALHPLDIALRAQSSLWQMCLHVVEVAKFHPIMARNAEACLLQVQRCVEFLQLLAAEDSLSSNSSSSGGSNRDSSEDAQQTVSQDRSSGTGSGVSTASDSRDSSSTDTNGSHSTHSVYRAVFELQTGLCSIPFVLKALDLDQRAPALWTTVRSFAHSSCYVKAAMQTITAHCCRMHSEHTWTIQQQQQQQQQQQSKKQQQQRADLLAVPPFHEGVMTELHISQAYVDGLAYTFNIGGRSYQEVTRQCLHYTCHILKALMGVLLEGNASESHPPLVSTGGVLLSVELLLLVAGLVQRLRQQQQQQQRQQQQASAQQATGLKVKVAADVLVVSAALLQLQIHAATHNAAGLSALQQVVLPRAGLQLLQALVAPLQQLQLSQEGEPLLQLPTLECVAGVLYALVAVTGRMQGVTRQVRTGDFMAVTASPTLQGNPLADLSLAHPGTYAGFIDCAVRCQHVAPIDLLVAAELLKHAAAPLYRGASSMQAYLSNTSAVVALASAIASIVKRIAVCAKAAGRAQSQPAAGAAQTAEATRAAVTAYNFPGAIPLLTLTLISNTAWALRSGAVDAITDCGCSSSSSSSSTGRSNSSSIQGNGSSISSQAKASALLLTVVLARSLVVLVDAHHAAAAAAGTTPAQLWARCVMSRPHLRIAWDAEHQGKYETYIVGLLGGLEHRTVASQWKKWKLLLADITRVLHATVVMIGMQRSSNSSSSSSSSNMSSGLDSSSGGNQLRWGHLLGLHECSQFAPTIAALRRKWPDLDATLVAAAAMPACPEPSAEAAAAAVDVDKLYDDSLEYCRVLVAAAPLPLVCNNPGCENLGGESEASVALKMCAGCRCRYCSLSCQEADWKRHKPACRRMAAAGEACS